MHVLKDNVCVNANGSSRLDASHARYAFSSQAACEFVAHSGDSMAADIEIATLKWQLWTQAFFVKGVKLKVVQYQDHRGYAYIM